MPKKRWVRCDSCGHIFESGVINATCSSCHKKHTTELQKEEVDELLAKGEIEESAKKQGPWKPGRRSEGKVGASKTISLNPNMMALYEHYCETTGEKPSISEWLNKIGTAYYKEQGIEPSIAYNMASGKQFTLPYGAAPPPAPGTPGAIRQRLDEMTEAKAVRLAVKEYENMVKAEEMALEKEQKKMYGPEPPLVQPGMNIAEMTMREQEREQYEMIMEERRLKMEQRKNEAELRLLQIAKKKKELEEVGRRPEGHMLYGPGEVLYDANGKPVVTPEKDPMKELLDFYKQKSMLELMAPTQQQQPQSDALTAEKVLELIEKSNEKSRRETEIDGIRREIQNRDDKLTAVTMQLNQERVQRERDELYGHMRNLQAKQQALEQGQSKSELATLAEMQRDYPWVFNQGQTFNPEKEKMDMESEVLHKSLTLFDKALERGGKGADRVGKTMDKMVDLSIDKQKQSQHREYGDEDLESMYNNLASGGEDAITGEHQEAQTSPVMGSDVPREEYGVDDFKRQPQPTRIPSPAQAATIEPPAEPRRGKKIGGGLAGPVQT